MAARGRLVTVLAGGSVAALCTFFLLTDMQSIEAYYDRVVWSAPQDNPGGSVIYIDKLLSYVPWTRQMFRMIESELTRQAPQWEMAVWYRPGHGDLPDRRYTHVRRRRCDAAKLHG